MTSGKAATCAQPEDLSSSTVMPAGDRVRNSAPFPDQEISQGLPRPSSATSPRLTPAPSSFGRGIRVGVALGAGLTETTGVRTAVDEVGTCTALAPRAPRVARASLW